MAKKKQSKLRRVISALNPTNPKGMALLFALIFALSGAGVYLYQSFAAVATNPYSCSPSIYGIPTVTIQRGSTGSCVKHLQWYLNKFNYGYGPLAELPLPVNGSFGSDTESLVKRVQRRCPAQVSLTGVVSSKTWGVLVAEHYTYAGRPTAFARWCGYS